MRDKSMKNNENYIMTDGPVSKALFLFSMPIIITNVVQLLFHMMDVAVLAIMVDDMAVAAVGACGSLITLLLGIFTGFATGSNVLLARRIGEENIQGVKKAVGASLSIGLASGSILMVVGIIFARDFLVLMNCQPDVLDSAVNYMTIYFLGMPVIMLYNFVASIFRAFGDSVRPMKYMLITGVVNICLNMFFVGVLGLSVSGVAIATVIANFIALFLALTVLLKGKQYCKIEKNDLRVKKEEFTEIVKVGVPTCFCSIFFYVANVILSSVVNSMSTDAMTANTISGQFDGIIYNVGSSIAIATSVIIGQNYGAKKVERIKKTMRVSIVYTTSVSLLLGVVFVLLSDVMLGLMTESQSIIDIAKDKMVLLCLTYFITSIMEVLAFSLRAMQHSNITMLVGGICGLGIRVAWAWFIWPMHPTLSMLFQSYGVSAFVAIIIYTFVYRYVLKQMGENN